MSGWQLDDAASGSAPFPIEQGTILAPKKFIVYFGSQTHIGLNNSGETVRLLHPDGTIADSITYDPLKTNASDARSPDGATQWVTTCIPTPRAENCSIHLTPTPTPVFTLRSISDARNLPDETLVSVLGSVVAHPCEWDQYGHELTLGDGMAGIDVYLPFPDHFSCTMPRGEQIVVTGYVRDHFGMRTIYPRSERDITRHYKPPREIVAQEIHTGDLGEANESMLLMVQGAVSNGKGGGEIIWVNDGTGMVELHWNAVTGASFAGITRGSTVRVYGVGFSYKDEKSQNEEYYIRPRAPDDIAVLDLAEKLPDAPGGGGVDLGAVSIEQALSTRTQNYVTVGGTLIVPPGVLGERDFWIQDASGHGAHIYVSASAGDPPRLQLHENVTVRGRVVSSFGAREIRVEFNDAIGEYGIGAPVAARAVRTGGINSDDAGALIELEGRVARERGREIYIDDGSGELLVYIDSGTHIHWPRLQVGDPARIVGIVTQFRGEPEILPRYQSDVQFGVMLLPVTGAQQFGEISLRARGRVGEDLELTRKLVAHASARTTRRAINTPTQRGAPRLQDAPPLKTRAAQPFSIDSLAFASLALLAASAISGGIALGKYRAARSRSPARANKNSRL